MNKTVLIADDSNSNNILLQSKMESEGINSSSALNSNKAFKFLKIEKPALILLDIMMPNIDVFSILKLLKNSPDTKEIPVTFITVKNDENLKQKAIHVGAQDLIQKPSDVNKVLNLVKEILLN